jgi:hypothetical protein
LNPQSAVSVIRLLDYRSVVKFFPGVKIDRFRGSGFRGSGFRGSEVQRFRVQGFRGSGVQGSGVQGFRGSVPPLT